mgnify:FL=1
MPDEKREKQEVPDDEKEVPEVLKNLQDTFNFYFKDDKEQS